MIIKGQSTDLERLGKVEVLVGDACISLEKENKIDFANVLGVSRDGNRKNQVMEKG